MRIRCAASPVRSATCSGQGRWSAEQSSTQCPLPPRGRSFLASIACATRTSRTRESTPSQRAMARRYWSCRCPRPGSIRSPAALSPMTVRFFDRRCSLGGSDGLGRERFAWVQALINNATRFDDVLDLARLAALGIGNSKLLFRLMVASSMAFQEFRGCGPAP